MSGTSHRVTTLPLAIAAAFLVACQDAPTTVDAPPVAQAPPGACAPWPGCKDDGGGGDDGDGGGGEITEASFAGGLVATAQQVDVKRDNKRALDVEHPAYSVDVELENTYLTALNDKTAMTACQEWNIPTDDPVLSEELKDALVEALDPTPASIIELTVGVDKDAALEGTASRDNHIRLAAGSLEDRPTVFLGRSGGPFLAFNYDDGDADPGNDSRTINDASVTRTFTGSGGLVRVVKRFDEDGDGALESNEPIASLICALEDAFTVTVAPQ